MLLLLLGCAPDKACETGQYCAAFPDTSPDGEGDADVDADADADTAVAAIYYVAAFATAGARFQSGYFGFEAEPLAGGSVLCSAVSQFADNGPSGADCPQCAWAFSLNLENGSGYGTECAELGMSEDMWDGFTASWGFSESYLYMPEYYAYPFESAVMYFSMGDQLWFPLAYSYNGYSSTTGDASYVSLRRVGDYAYYYP